MGNMYDYLRHEEYPDAEPVRDFSSDTISSDNEESISILTAEACPGKWVGGYSVCWKNGRHSFLAPSLSNGWFSSERETRLFYLGFMSGFSSYFTESNRKAINNAITRYSQASLF